MRRLWLFLLMCAAGFAQEGAVENGLRLYRLNCAVPYCHGPEGSAGRAPKLIGHNHTVNSMFKVITWGIPGTGMPEFTSRLKSREIADIVAYVMTLRGTPPPGASPQGRVPVTVPRVPPPEAKEGRALFFDASRTGACGTCHELDGWGVPAGPDLAALTIDRLDSLRKVPQKLVRTARPAGGEPPFPAVVAEQTGSRVRVYDLTAALPVLRSFAAGGIELGPNRDWQHENVTHVYNDRELEKIHEFLRWVTAAR